MNRASTSVSFQKVIERDYVVLIEREERVQVDEWPLMSLGQVTELTLSSVDKKIKSDESEVLLCNYMDVYSNSFIRSDFQFMVATATKREIERCTLQPGDVIITKDSEQYDDIGVPALVRDDVDNLVCGYHLAILRPLQNLIDGAYLLYSLQTTNVKHQFHAYANGVTRFGLRKDDIQRVVVPLPPPPEQRTIAHILGTLDDKIELNRRMNETLEAMARALFKSWFVDFDPVRAKMEGRDTGLPQHIADLFPDKLVDSELGEIPEGWGMGCIGDIANSPRRSVNPMDLPDDTPYIGLDHMPRQSISLMEWGSAVNITSNKSIFKKGDILFGKLRPYFHKVGIAPVGGICSTDIVVVTQKTAEWFVFLLACLSSTEFVNYTDQTSTGTKMPRTSWKIMASYRLCLPPPSILQEFQNVTLSLVEHTIVNIHECRTLAAMRDALLPKLMSGELRTRKIEVVAQ